jgi:hypothetical protein
MYPSDERASTHILPFGKHRGEPLSAAPTSYLVWCHRTLRLSSGLRVALATELLCRGVPVTVPPLPQPPSCCGSAELRYSWHQFANGERQVRRECPRCGRSLGFAPRVKPYTDYADASASPTALLDAVQLAEEEGVRLVSDGRRVRVEPWHEASARLKALVLQQQHLLARLLGREATS